MTEMATHELYWCKPCNMLPDKDKIWTKLQTILNIAIESCYCCSLPDLQSNEELYKQTKGHFPLLDRMFPSICTRWSKLTITNKCTSLSIYLISTTAAQIAPSDAVSFTMIYHTILCSLTKIVGRLGESWYHLDLLLEYKKTEYKY